MLFPTSLLFAHSVPGTAITKPFLHDSATVCTAFLLCRCLQTFLRLCSSWILLQESCAPRIPVDSGRFYQFLSLSILFSNLGKLSYILLEASVSVLECSVHERGVPAASTHVPTSFGA